MWLAEHVTGLNPNWAHHTIAPAKQNPPLSHTPRPPSFFIPNIVIIFILPLSFHPLRLTTTRHLVFRNPQY